MRAIITTTGTSIAEGIPYALRQDANSLREAIRERLKALRAKHPDREDFLRVACAETNSLRAIRDKNWCSDGDRIYLLHTDTNEGAACAAAVEELLIDAGDEAEIQIHRIEGLQVENAELFRNTGIQNLFSLLNRLCEQFGYDVILNATGGFKAVVPYLTLYGLLYRLRVVYIFERSKALLSLPLAPINFDYERLAQARDAILTLEKNTDMPVDDFFKLIPGTSYHDRHWYEPLIEETNGKVTLSAFGLLLFDRLKQDQAEVFLSPAAKKVYDDSSGPVRDQFDFMLQNVRDPLWRQSKRHSFANTDLTVFKPGNTSERMACILQGRSIYVCELLRHDEYMRTLPQRRQRDYDLSLFTRWSPPPGKEVPKTEEEFITRLRQQYDDLQKKYTCLQQTHADAEAAWRDERQQLKSQLDAQQQRAVEAERALAELQNQLDEAKRNAQQLAGQVAASQSRAEQLAEELRIARQNLADAQQRGEQLAAEVQDCRDELARRSKPWWRRLFARR